MRFDPDRGQLPAEQILVVPDEQAAVDTALHEAEAGDLLLIFGDKITRTWKQVIQYRPDAASQVIERIRPSQPALAVAVSADGGEDHRREFVRDSRGVRVPREEELED